MSAKTNGIRRRIQRSADFGIYPLSVSDILVRSGLLVQDM